MPLLIPELFFILGFDFFFESNFSIILLITFMQTASC